MNKVLSVKIMLSKHQTSLHVCAKAASCQRRTAFMILRGSLVMCEIEQLFMCLFAICVVSMNCLCLFFAHPLHSCYLCFELHPPSVPSRYLRLKIMLKLYFHHLRLQSHYFLKCPILFNIFLSSLLWNASCFLKIILFKKSFFQRLLNEVENTVDC